jgi:hypothetical protein
MDLYGCYSEDDDKPQKPKKEMPSPKKIFGVPRRTRFNLETTTKKAKKVEKKILRDPYAFNESSDRDFVL